ncbi:MAG: hypothetical protein AAFW89_14650 [Bacteroidota bacterium]
MKAWIGAAIIISSTACAGPDVYDIYSLPDERKADIVQAELTVSTEEAYQYALEAVRKEGWQPHQKDSTNNQIVTYWRRQRVPASATTTHRRSRLTVQITERTDSTSFIFINMDLYERRKIGPSMWREWTVSEYRAERMVQPVLNRIKAWAIEHNPG